MIGDKNPILKRWWLYAIILVVVIVLMVVLIPGKDEEKEPVDNNVTEQKQEETKKEEKSALAEELSEYKEKYEELEKNTKKLILEYKSLEKEKEKLIEENETLKEEIEKLKNGSYDSRGTNNNINLQNEPVYKIGKLVEINGKKVKVSGVKKSQGDAVNKPGIGNEFIVVSVTVINDSQMEISYNTSYFKLLTESGELVSAHLTAFNENTALNSGILSPGGKISGTIVYEQPKESQNLKLVYLEDLYPDNKAVFSISN